MNRNQRLKVTAVATSATLIGGFSQDSNAIDIVVDYTYDTNNFFNTAVKRDALQAAADRFSGIIDSDLAPVSASGTSSGTGSGWRVGFSHPGTGNQFQLSTASDSASDPLESFVGSAGGYGFSGLNANEWVLFAGGRNLAAAGEGGTGTGTNFTGVFNDINGPVHRGFDDNTSSNTTADLPRWGGSITFDTGTNWHFGIDSISGSGEVDFYTIALHEVGHALGLGASWNQWQDDGAGSYIGLGALDAYNADNGTSLTSLNLVSTTNDHWEDGIYQSAIFELGNPNLAGTVGLGVEQDLLIEPIANFSSTQSRIELTNTDVGALRDLGWSVVPEPSSFVLVSVGLVFGLRRRR